MPETITNNPNIEHGPELEQQASHLLVEIIDNPEDVGVSVEDGSYSKTETEYEVREVIEIGDERLSSEVWLKVSRALEHDPQVQLPGKFTETLVASTNIPSVASVRLMMVDGKMRFLEYSDPYASKGEEGLGEAIEAIKLAVEELR